MRAIARQGLNPVPLVWLDTEADGKSFRTEHFSLPLHWGQPFCIPLADMHINAQRFESVDPGLGPIRQVTGKTGY